MPKAIAGHIASLLASIDSRGSQTRRPCIQSESAVTKWQRGRNLLAVFQPWKVQHDLWPEYFVQLTLMMDASHPDYDIWKVA